MRVTLKAVNAELARNGHRSMLVSGDGYFYFRGGEAADWLDRTVRVPTLSSLTMDGWMQAFQDLKKKNVQVLHQGNLEAAAGNASKQATRRKREA